MVPSLPFNLTAMFFSYYIRLPLQESAYNQNRIWTLLLAEDVLMARLMCGISNRDGACTSYTTYNVRLDHILGGSLFRIQ